MKRIFTTTKEIKRIITLTFACVLFAFSATTYAANQGVITGIWVAGPDDPNHPNVVQISIAGGFSSGACHPTVAAVRSTADRKELIAFLLAAYTTNQSVTVVLNPSDVYFDSRCTIARVSNQ